MAERAGADRGGSRIGVSRGCFGCGSGAWGIRVRVSCWYSYSYPCSYSAASGVAPACERAGGWVSPSAWALLVRVSARREGRRV